MIDTSETKPRHLQTVLLVEDDPGIRSALGLFLELLEVRHVSACNGEEAIEILKDEEIDVLITDFRMPKVNGVELLKWCRTHDKHFPVIFISADADLLEKEEIALKDCCASLMRKPVQIADLEKALEAALSRSHHEQCVHVSGCQK